MPTERTPPDGGKSIDELLRSAAAFYDRHRGTPEVMHLRPRLADRGRGVSRDIPNPEWLRRCFDEWIANLFTDFGGAADGLKKQVPQLLALACDGKAWTKDWRFPGWLIDFPDEAAPEALLAAGERLDQAETKKVFRGVRIIFGKRAGRPGRTVGGQEPEHDEWTYKTEIKRGGRPRKDKEREKVREKKDAGKSWEKNRRRDERGDWPRKVPEAYRGLLKSNPSTERRTGKNGKN